MKKIVYVNKMPKQFDDISEYVKDRLECYYNGLGLDCKINVKFIESATINTFEITDCMIRNLSEKEHDLIITYNVLNTIYNDGGKFFCHAIYHEFEHIKDYVNFMKTKLFNFNLCLTHHKSFERQYISCGYLFWTEVYAYYKTLEFAKENEIIYEKIRFGDLVSCYKKTIELNRKYYYKKDLSQQESDEYVKAVDSFVYLCAKYMASSYINHSRIPRAKIEKNEDYNKVYRILAGLHPKIIKIVNCNYGAKSDVYLFGLGKYICEKVKWKIFNVGLTEIKGKIYSFY